MTIRGIIIILKARHAGWYIIGGTAVIRVSNREKTFSSVVSILKYMEANHAQFSDSGDFQTLPVDRKLQLAMQFYQCERGRMQKAKMAFDVLSSFAPLVISLAALWFATK